MRRVLSLAALAGLVLAFQPLIAAVPTNAFDGLTDEAVAVWQHRDRGSPTGWDIWYSAIGRPSPTDPTSALAWHASGGPVTQAAPVATLAGDDKNPHVGRNASGETIAVWQHAPGEGTSPGDWDIYWSRLDPATGSWSTPEAVAVVMGDDYDPNVALDSAGNAIVVWSHRNPDGTREIYSSILTAGVGWSTPVSAGSSGGEASLPEVALTSVPAASGSVLATQAVAAWADTPGPPGTSHRMFAATFDGLSWTPAVEIESGATGVSLSIDDVGFADYVGTDPDPFGAFGRLGVTADGSGNALIVWGGGPIILGYGSPGVVGAILDVTTGTWTEMLTPFGSRYIGVGGCENPDDALTTGGGDFVGVFDFAGVIEHTFRTGGAFTSETFSYDWPALNDQRPSDAAVSTTEVISVNWGADWLGTGGTGPATEIIWSVGTVTPGVDVTWAGAAELVPGSLGGEDMFPEIASGFVPPSVSADAYTVNLTINGAPTPVAVRTLADARTEGGSATNEIAEFVLPGGLGKIRVGRNEATAGVTPGLPPGGSAAATSTITEASLLGGLIEAEAVRAASSTSLPPASSTNAGTRIARLSVGGAEVEVPAPAPTAIPVPGVGTLTLFEEVAASDGATFSELEVRALHLVGTVDGLDIDLIVNSAYSGVSAGPPLTPRPPTTPAIEPSPGALPPVPGVGPWPPAAVPNVPCPDVCYGPLPGDSVSETVPTPIGPVTATRSRFGSGDADNGYAFSATSLSFPFGSVVLYDSLGHSSYEFGGSTFDGDGKSAAAYVSLFGQSTSVGAARSQYTSTGPGFQTRADFVSVGAGAGGTAGSLSVSGSVGDLASLFDPAYDYRERTGSVTISYSAPTGQWVYLALSAGEARLNSSGVVFVSGYVCSSATGCVGPSFAIPIPVMPPV